MSKTIKHKLEKHRPNGRANIYGLCRCTQCRHGRYAFKAHIDRLKKRIRIGVGFVKGMYTD